MMHGFGFGNFGWIGLIVMILFWGSLIFGGVWLVKTIFTNGQQSTSGKGSSEQTSSRDIIDNRYARGEITREQFEIMKADLSD